MSSHETMSWALCGHCWYYGDWTIGWYTGVICCFWVLLFSTLVPQSILMSSFGNQDTRRTIVSSSFEMSHQGSGRAQLEHKPISHRSCGLSVLRRESQEHRERRWLTPHRVPTQPNHRGSAPHSLRAFVGSWLAGWSLGTTVTQKTQRHSVKWQSKLCQQRI